MKIAFLSSTFHGSGGSGVYAKRFVEALLKQKGVDGVLVVTKEDRKTDTFLGQKIINIPTSAPSHLKRYEFGLKCTNYVDALKREGVDITHAEHSFEGLLAHKYKKKYGAPFVYVREVVSKEMPSFYMKHVLFNIEKYLTEHLDYDILVSWTKNMVDNYFSKWNVDQSKIRLIPGGMDLSYFNPGGKYENIRAKYGIDEDDFLLVSAKILSSSNVAGLLTAIRSFAEFSKTRPDAKYIICGNGSKRSALDEEIRKLGLERQVRIVEGINSPELLHFYRSADATVQLFLYEASISVSMMESLACGTPVITTSVGETPNVITDKVNGLMTRPDIHEVAGAMSYLYEHPDERKRIAINSRKLAEDRFDINKIAKAYVDIYRALLEKKG